MIVRDRFVYHVNVMHFVQTIYFMNIVIYNIINSVKSIFFSKLDSGQYPCKFSFLMGNGTWSVLLDNQSKH